LYKKLIIIQNIFFYWLFESFNLENFNFESLLFCLKKKDICKRSCKQLNDNLKMRSLLIYECVIYHFEIERVLQNRMSLRENIYTFRFHAILLSDEVQALCRYPNETTKRSTAFVFTLKNN